MGVFCEEMALTGVLITAGTALTTEPFAGGVGADGNKEDPPATTLRVPALTTPELANGTFDTTGGIPTKAVVGTVPVNTVGAVEAVVGLD